MSRRPRVLFHLTLGSTVDPRREAVLREVSLLCDRLVEGRSVHIAGRGRLALRLPRSLWGLQYLLTLRSLEARADLHHVFNPDPFLFPYLRFLRRPVVFSAVSGLAGMSPAAASPRALRPHLVVPDPGDREELTSLGFSDTTVIRPGVDADRFTASPPGADLPFTLLMGSAPWTRAQFRSKGIEAILQAAVKAPDMRFVLLWRGELDGDIERAIADHAVSDRVTVHHDYVDVNQVLTEVHAGVLLATHAALVKAYPQSLLECLVAGRPVIVSRTIPIASYVDEHGCGEIAEQVTAAALIDAIERLRSRYEECRQRSRPAALRDFSIDRFVSGYAAVYRRVLDGASAARGHSV